MQDFRGPGEAGSCRGPLATIILISTLVRIKPQAGAQGHDAGQRRPAKIPLIQLDNFEVSRNNRTCHGKAVYQKAFVTLASA